MGNIYMEKKKLGLTHCGKLTHKNNLSIESICNPLLIHVIAYCKFALH